MIYSISFSLKFLLCTLLRQCYCSPENVHIFHLAVHKAILNALEKSSVELFILKLLFLSVNVWCLACTLSKIQITVL